MSECSPYLDQQPITEREDKLLRAARELLEQIGTLSGIEFTKDTELHEAEACWDDAMRRLSDALEAYKDRS